MLSSRRFLLPPALTLLLISFSNAAPYDFLDNYRDPAPAPEDGPPASYHANRNKSTLKWEICGLVGAYVVTVLIWGVLLLTVGRRMRRRALQPPKSLELELQHSHSGKPQPTPLKTPASPQSARSATSSWFKRNFKKDSAVSSPSSPVVHSPNSFDQKVIDSDRERAQAEMERLYAAVMDHDRKKSYSQVDTEAADFINNERQPPHINTDHRTMGTGSTPTSPVKAIYPPGHPRERAPASPRSVLSKKSQSSQTSTTSKGTRFNLKNLRISGPIHKYPGERDDDEARTPLSPRFYQPGVPPSPPTQQNSPTTPHTIEEAYENLDEVQPLPRPAPQRAGSANQTPTSVNAPGGGFHGNKSASSSVSTLPLRGYAEPLKSPDLRTTVLDRRVDKLSMTTPKTGVPYTPYSPYMPFTPVTPVTPHLVTKKERKMMNKMEGKRRGYGYEREEMVQSPKEIFGDAY